MSGVRLEARKVSVRIGSHTVLTDVDLTLNRAEVIALVGPNGAGKSTLLHLLAGDRTPDSGEVELDGKPLTSYRTHELARIRAVLTQSNEVSFPFTVGEVVAMGRSPWGSSADVGRDDELIERALDDAELSDFVERRVPELSGGERARVAYARVRAQDCEIVMLDEPTASLDIRHQERLLQQLRVHADAGGSAVVVLHDLNLAAAYADRIVLIDHGRVRVDGPPHEALTSETLSDVYRYPIAVHRIDDALLIQPLRPRNAAVLEEETANA